MRIKITAVILLIAILCTTLSSCSALEIIELVNNLWGLFEEDNTQENNFNINFQIPDPNRCTNHTIVPLASIAPTCQTPGVSGGQVCSRCGTVIVAQIELPAIDHVYDDTSDKDCNLCGFIRTVKCDHLYTFVTEAILPTCTATGRTQGERCTGCGKIIAGFEIIDPTDHVYDGARDDTCNECGYKRKLECFHDVTQKLDAVAPTCTQTGLTIGNAWVHCGEILIPQREIPKADHTESDWIVDKVPTKTDTGEIHTECTVCNLTIKTGFLDMIEDGADANASKGLSFAINADNNSYTLVDIGTCNDTEIVIPRYYNGLPVTKIGDGAFLNKSGILSIIIPEGILNVGNGAFKECTSLQSVFIPSSVTSIGEYAFYNCALLSITLPEGLTRIEKYTFFGCDFTTLDIPYGIISIGEGAFAECTSINALTLPSSLEIIDKKAFFNLAEVLTVVIPKSVISIGEMAFNVTNPDGRAREFTIFNYVSKIGAYAFTTNSTINYKGTKAEWNSILIDPRNYQYVIVATDGSFID